jgi:hypothetical protein
MKTKSQVGFDCLHQYICYVRLKNALICLGNIVSLLTIAKKKGIDHSSSHKCLVKWDDISKTKSWINTVAFSMSREDNFLSPHSVL